MTGVSPLISARESYCRLLDLYRPLDQRIAADVPDWDPGDRFCSHLVSLCEDTVLTMLGADRRLTEPEWQAFNEIFGLEEAAQDIEAMSLWLNQKAITETELFTRLDRFVLASALADVHTGSQRTEQALAFFQTLGQLFALIDDQYHPEEDAFFRALSERIVSDWRRSEDFIAESQPALMLTLSDGRLKLYPL